MKSLSKVMQSFGDKLGFGCRSTCSGFLRKARGPMGTERLGTTRSGRVGGWVETNPLPLGNVSLECSLYFLAGSQPPDPPSSSARCAPLLLLSTAAPPAPGASL